ncbi:MAG: transporter, partial [Vitreimonas sp.]
MSGSLRGARLRALLAASAATLALLYAAPARATEGGASLYLLGSGGPGAAIMPPVEGVFLNNTVYYYSGDASAERDFIIGGNVVAGIEAEILADFATVLWVPTTDLGGATAALGLVLAFGQPDVTASAVLT